MKNLIVTGMLVLGMGTASYAQGTVPNQRTTPQNEQNDQYIRSYSDGMAKDLGLDDKQREKLYEQNSAHYLNQQSVHSQDITGADRSKAQQSAQKKYETQLRGILNEDQYKRFDDNRDKYKFEYPQEHRRTPTQEGEPMRPRSGQ